MADTVSGCIVGQGNGGLCRCDRCTRLCRSGGDIACTHDLRTVKRRVGCGRGREAAALDNIAVEQLLRHLVDEAGRVGVLRAAVQQTALGAGEIQLLLRARHSDVAQAALLLHVLLLFHRAEAGEQAVLHAGEEHDRELEALCRVHRHHDDRILVLARLVCIGVKRHVFEEVAKRRIFVLFLVVDDIGLELLDVLDAAFLLCAALELKRTEIAALVEQFIIQLGERNELTQSAQIFDHLTEFLHRRRAARQGRVLRGMAHDVIERDAVLDCGLHRRFDRFIADLARRNVDDAAQAQLIRRILDHPEVGEHILDLGTGEEVAALVNAVRHARSDEGGGDVVRQHVVAVEYREIAPAAALLDALADRVRDIACLTLLTVRAVQLDLRAGAVVGPELLALASDVVADDLVRGIQNVAGRAVVLLQTDGFRVLELLFEFKDIRDGRAAELVNALIVIADDADVLIVPGEQAGQYILCVVRILILVYEHIAELVLIKLEHLRVVLEQQHGFHDDVVEIERTRLFHFLFVLAVDIRDLFAEIVAGRIGSELLRRHELILRAADHAHHGARIERLGVEVQFFHHIRDDALFVVLIVDGERALEAQQVDMPAKNAQAGGMEGIRPDCARGLLITERKLESLAQLAGGLIGEGDGDHLPRLCRTHRAQVLGPRPVFRLRVIEVFCEKQQIVIRCPFRGKRVGKALSEAQQIDDAVDEYGSFSAARARKDEQGAVCLENRFALPGVELFKALLDDRLSNGCVFHIKFGRFHICPRFVMKIYKISSRSGRRLYIISISQTERENKCSFYLLPFRGIRSRCISCRSLPGYRPSGRYGRRRQNSAAARAYLSAAEYRSRSA